MDAKSLRGIKKESESHSVISDSATPWTIHRNISKDDIPSFGPYLALG